MESSLEYFGNTLLKVSADNISEGIYDDIMDILSDVTNDTGSNNVPSVSILEQDLDPDAEFLRFLLLGVGICTICALGIVGNILSIIVLSNHRMRSSISCLLLGLSVCDLVILLNSALFIGLPQIMLYYKKVIQNDKTDSGLKPNIVGYLMPLILNAGMTALTGSVYFTIAVTLERYFAVCQPFLARRICTWNRASLFALGIFVLSSIYNLPRFFELKCSYETIILPDNSTYEGCRVVPTELKNNPSYDLYYVHILFILMHYCIPTCSLIVINGLIYYKIREANKNRKILSASESKENSLAYMLFLVVAIFIACNTLLPIHALVKLIAHTDTPPEFQVVKVFLLILNSSVNFTIYCTYGGKFREVFLDLLPLSCCKKLNRPRQGSDLSTSSRKSELGSFYLQKMSKASVKTIIEEV